jgi:predicted MPP superfamily phosphohydrolase
LGKPVQVSTASRRLRYALLGSFAFGLLLALWGFWLEPQRLVVSRSELRLTGWPSPLSGLKVALLADLHIGSPHWDLAALDRLVERTNAERPDLVLLAGDYQINDVMGGSFVQAEPIAEGLSRLRAPLGVFAVLGNHDWWNDGERSRRAFTAHGIRVLEEEHVRIERGDASFYLVGLADQMTRKSQVQTALSGIPPGAATLVLVHEPDVFQTFPRLQVAPTLTLAGHTHGGQVWLPLLGRLVVPSRFGQRYAYGHIVEGPRHLFVTSGVGTSIFPVRFLVPPEIALLTLR